MEKNPRRNIRRFGAIVRDKEIVERYADMINSFRNVEPSTQENNGLLQEAEEE